MEQQRLKELAVFDIECYPNYFLTCFQTYSGKRFYWDSSKGFDGLEEWIDNRIIVGYNSKNYDIPMLSMALLKLKQHGKAFNDSEVVRDIFCSDMKKLSDDIIQSKKLPKWAWNHKRKLHIDLCEILRQGFSTKPLKLVAVSLKHDNIQDLPYEHTRVLTPKEKTKVFEYCWNDVDKTYKLLKLLQPRIEMREEFGKELGIGLDLISEADSGMSNIVFDKFYVEESGMPLEQLKKLRTYRRYDMSIKNEILKREYDFHDATLKSFYEHLKERYVYYGLNDKNEIEYSLGNIHTTPSPFVRMEKKGKYDKGYDTKGRIEAFTLNCFDTSITFGLGGIHTEDDAGFVRCESDEQIIDEDVEAYYPYGMLNYDICPAHLDKEVFKRVYKIKGVDARIEAKSKKKIRKYAIKDKGLKIFINNIYGKTNYDGYYLYDPLCSYQVTINNQLGILELADMLHYEGRAKIVSINTDGVTVIIKRGDYKMFKDVCAKWEAKSQFKLEEAEYEWIARLNINNYFAKLKGKEPKVKGSYFNPFINEVGHEAFDIMKGFEAPIVAIALYKWLNEGKDTTETIMSHIASGGSIYDFCIANRVSDDYENVLQNVKLTWITHSPKTKKAYKKPKLEIEIIKEQVVQRTMRYYVAHTNSMLVKRHKEDGSTVSHQKGWTIMPFNKYVKYDDWHIDYRWYIAECEKVKLKLTKNKEPDDDTGND